MAVIIGMTAFFNEDNGKVHKINTSYVEAILNAGAIPLIIPVTAHLEHIDAMISRIDGLLIPGGQDVAPHFYGEEAVPQVTFARAEDDTFEFALIKKAQAAGKPILGICRGLQVINVAFGGSLYQDIPTMCKTSIGHVQSSKIRDEPMHTVLMEEGSALQKIFGEKCIHVNTYHHQSIKEIAPGFKVVGSAKDGIVEAIESTDASILAVQWHPEGMQNRFPMFKNLFTHFVALCEKK